MPMFTRVSNAWKSITGIYVRVSGSWKSVTNAWVRDSGSWKLVYSLNGQLEQLTPGQSTWTVPAGVTSIHACVVAGSGGALSEIRRGATSLLSSSSTVGTNFGGGDGGWGPDSSMAGGGGAGGYSGHGGAGHSGQDGVYGNGAAGAGGGGGGGRSASTLSSRQHGGGVYLHGAGSNGAGGTAAAAPGAGSNLGEGSPRGAGRKGLTGGTVDNAQSGGNLRYTKTAITVTPGETLTLVVGAVPTSGDATCGGGVRIIWGPGRSYPNNAKDA